ncbi:MAG TPA: hypothetical protein VLQ93_20020 [Myxococcaceae bacterium]|nr:hypothetical protein [Myxococcaceae bacterium]
MRAFLPGFRGAPATDEYRRRLEGRAELLEAARSRYRALVEAVKASRWDERLRSNLSLLREARAVQARVDEALTAALRRAAAEGWPARHPTVRCLYEVRALREELAGAVARRLARGAEEPLGVLLEALEEEALTAPREVPPARRQEVARELLPDTPPALEAASTFGSLLESLFARPFDAQARLPFSRAQRVDLRQRWPAGEEALAALWRRLERVDVTGGLASELRRQAGLAPRRPPGSGVERLLHAEYWSREARRWLEHLARTRLAPVVPAPEECVEVATWLLVREEEPEARLPASPLLSEARAGLLELACELWEARHPGLPDEARWTAARWARLEARAARADQAGGGEDAERVRRLLRELIQVYGVGGTALRGWRDSPRLGVLVGQARALLG